MAATRPVLIVGAGPTGMTAAIELNRFGIPVRLIDKLLEPVSTSRAAVVQARTLELFEQRGLANTMLEAGNKGIAASFYGHDKLGFRMEFSDIDSRYHYLLCISEAETERILRERLTRQGVAIEWGVTLTAFAQADLTGSLTTTLLHSDGRLEEFEPSYLIDAVHHPPPPIEGVLFVHCWSIELLVSFNNWVNFLHLPGFMQVSELSL